jgi:hypothetical protein
LEELDVGAFIMLGTLFGLTFLVFALVIRFDPQVRGLAKRKRVDNV